MVELKDIYSDAILRGAIDGSDLMMACDARSLMDGPSELTMRTLACHMAHRRAEKLQGDPGVAYGIASILYASSILYGKTGEAFLQEKLQQCGESFSQEEYSNAFAEAVLNGHDGEWKQKTLQGVRAALSDVSHPEANAAKTAIVLQENWIARIFEDNDALEEACMNGEVLPMQTLCEKMRKSRYGEIEEAAALENLNILYAYLKRNPSTMHERYKTIYPEVSEEKRLAYYISKLGHEEVERVKARALKEGAPLE